MDIIQLRLWQLSGLAVTESVNGKIIHQSILIENETNILLVPIYSSSGNYKILHLINNDSTVSNSTNGVSSDFYMTLQAYTLTNGIGFNQRMTEALIAFSATSGAVVAGAFSAGVGAMILIVGASAIAFYDAMGGNNGISIVTTTVQVMWRSVPVTVINSPFDPNGSDVTGIETIYSGCFK